MENVLRDFCVDILRDLFVDILRDLTLSFICHPWAKCALLQKMDGLIYTSAVHRDASHLKRAKSFLINMFSNFCIDQKEYL